MIHLQNKLTDLVRHLGRADLRGPVPNLSGPSEAGEARLRPHHDPRDVLGDLPLFCCSRFCLGDGTEGEKERQFLMGKFNISGE